MVLDGGCTDQTCLTPLRHIKNKAVLGFRNVFGLWVFGHNTAKVTCSSQVVMSGGTLCPSVLYWHC